jgi:hypothetical protein
VGTGPVTGAGTVSTSNLPLPPTCAGNELFVLEGAPKVLSDPVHRVWFILAGGNAGRGTGSWQVGAKAELEGSLRGNWGGLGRSLRKE